MRRCAARDGSSPDPQEPSQRRYVAGQQIYLDTCTPQRQATFVINNDVLDAPVLVAPPAG